MRSPCPPWLRESLTLQQLLRSPMPNVSNLVKTIQDIMRKDAGTYGDAQRLEQLGWMFFLKIFDDREKEIELIRDRYRSPLPANLRWSASVFACLRRCSIAQTRKPPVPQAGSRIVSRFARLGFTCSTMNCVTARGV